MPRGAGSLERLNRSFPGNPGWEAAGPTETRRPGRSASRSAGRPDPGLRAQHTAPPSRRVCSPSLPYVRDGAGYEARLRDAAVTQPTVRPTIFHRGVPSGTCPLFRNHFSAIRRHYATAEPLAAGQHGEDALPRPSHPQPPAVAAKKLIASFLVLQVDCWHKRGCSTATASSRRRAWRAAPSTRRTTAPPTAPGGPPPVPTFHSAPAPTVTPPTSPAPSASRRKTTRASPRPSWPSRSGPR